MEYQYGSWMCKTIQLTGMSMSIIIIIIIIIIIKQAM
jgi:hypothetical protein